MPDQQPGHGRLGVTTSSAQALQAAQSQWLRGVTDLLLLSCLASGPNYGYALLERLVGAGLRTVSEAAVYGALRRLESTGLCTSSLVASDSGPARRYYTITGAGRAELAALRTGWAAFSSAVDDIVKEVSR